MTAKEYLRQIGRMELHIYQKKAELKKLRQEASTLKGVGYDGIRVQSGPGKAVEETAIRLADLDAEIEREIIDLSISRHKIIGEIQSVENRTYEALLYKRYVELKTLELISTEMNYSYEHIRRLHGWALKSFEKQHPERFT